MTLAQALNIEPSEIDNLCQYFTDELKNPDNWTYPVTNFGIDEVEILHQKYTIWTSIKKGNNIGRYAGTSSGQVNLLGGDIQQNGIDPTQPPIFVDIDDEDTITGEHRGETSGNLGIPGWMTQFVRIHEKDPIKRAWIKKRLAKALNNTRMFNQLNNSPEDIKEHIQFGIKNGHLTSQSQIEDEIKFQSNNSLGLTEQKGIILEGYLVKDSIIYSFERRANSISFQPKPNTTEVSI